MRRSVVRVLLMTKLQESTARDFAWSMTERWWCFQFKWHFSPHTRSFYAATYNVPVLRRESA